MSRAFISNIVDFLDEKGAISETLSLKSKRLLEHLRIIIQTVNSRQQADTPTPLPIPCWSAPYKKRCKGKIDASIEIPYYDILWHCLLCGNHGTIRNWKGTFLDKENRCQKEKTILGEK